MGLECEYNDTLEKKTVSILDTQSQWPPLAILMIDCRSLRAVNQDIQMEQMFRTPIFLGGGNCLKLIWKYDSTQVRHLTVFAFELNLLCFMSGNMILRLSIFFFIWSLPTPQPLIEFPLGNIWSEQPASSLKSFPSFPLMIDKRRALVGFPPEQT